MGNSSDYRVCIPADPKNTVETCAPYEAELLAKARARALEVCVENHGVKCVKKKCDFKCLNGAVMTSSQGMVLEKNDCAENEDARYLSNTDWDCTCDCVRGENDIL